MISNEDVLDSIQKHLTSLDVEYEFFDVEISL
jgi:hypothetical protein